MLAIISVWKSDLTFWKRPPVQHFKQKLLYKPGAQPVQQRSSAQVMIATSKSW